ncbi:MAG: hypothetical protein WDO73_29210 [Ignavibacteriota bacterium]
MNAPKYWPLDMDDEQIYDNPAWDLPGFRRRPPLNKKNPQHPALKSSPQYV